VVAAEQVKDAVHDQMSEVVGQWLTLLGRLADHRLEGEHNVSEQKRRAWRNPHSRLPGRKREHIGRQIPPPEAAIKPTLLLIVGKRDAEFDPRR
jgi:hypothetical protein